MSQNTPSRTLDKVIIRLPDGLRERIKVYADQEGRSMNAEIVRVLEREYPAPWTMRSRLNELREKIKALKKGAPLDKGIEDLVRSFEETFAGLMSDRIKDVDATAWHEIYDCFQEYKKDVAKYEDAGLYDAEEDRQLRLDGTTAKFVDVNAPKKQKKPEPELPPTTSLEDDIEF